jgi:putative hydrolase of HD superfamily
MKVTDDVIDVFFEGVVVKRIHRTGWQILGDHEEKVGEHSFITAVIAHFLAKLTGADLLKVYQMAVFHDFHEARTGEIDKVARFYVTRDQDKANHDIFSQVDQELLNLLEEYEDKQSLESRVTYEANILALLVELKVLLERGHKPAKEWLEDTVARLKLPESQALAKQLMERDQHAWWKKLRESLSPESRHE